MDNNEHKPAFSNPHWKADESYNLKESDSSSKSIRIPVRALNIIWGNDSRFWRWIKLTEEDTKSTMFEEGIVLLQVNWIQVTGKLSIVPCMVASTIEYEVVYIVKFRADAFGWHSVPIKFKVRFNGEERVKSVVLESYKEKQNQWHEILGGSFTVSSSKHRLGSVVVEFAMFEGESDWWKGGLVLAGIKIRPKLIG